MRIDGIRNFYYTPKLRKVEKPSNIDSNKSNQKQVIKKKLPKKYLNS